MENEIWKSVLGYEGLYVVSNLGRICSLWDGRHQIHRTKVLKPGKNNGGYLFVNLWKNGEKKMFLVHRLVAIAFIPNPEGKPEVNHLTEDKTKNSVDSIEWVTHKENINYGTGKERSARAQMNDKKKSKPVIQYTIDGEFIKEFPSSKEAERQTGIFQSNIVACLKGRQKSARGYVWKYKLLR